MNAFSIEPVFPTLHAMPPLSALLRDGAETLAVQINEGLYAALPADTRCDLRALSLEMAAWGDLAREIEANDRPMRRRGRHLMPWRTLSQALRRLLAMATARG